MKQSQNNEDLTWISRFRVPNEEKVKLNIFKAMNQMNEEQALCAILKKGLANVPTKTTLS